ncbi:hypothetical protein LP419_12645 [Massilia sp. H-1]|nr:hypothetical protein LP419_12645 [Massilia sp. H-1]
MFYTALLPDLKQRGKTVIIISHDDAYFNVADRIVRLQDGLIKHRHDAAPHTVVAGREELREQKAKLRRPRPTNSINSLKGFILLDLLDNATAAASHTDNSSLPLIVQRGDGSAAEYDFLNNNPDSIIATVRAHAWDPVPRV